MLILLPGLTGGSHNNQPAVSVMHATSLRLHPPHSGPGEAAGHASHLQPSASLNPHTPNRLLLQRLPADAPVLILLPGLTGGSHDTYIRHMVGLARRQGMRAICFNSRGTSDGPVVTPQFYSASFTGDCR